MTPIADMIEAMLANGATLDVILLAVRSLELSGTSPGQVRDNVRSRREYERMRKRVWRNKINSLVVKPEANDAGLIERNVPENIRDMSLSHCDLTSSFLSIESPLKEGSKEVKTVVVEGRKRGTRLSPETPLNEIDRKFALENGVENPDQLWAEFIDYWTGIPGQRGIKLTWSGTWRNRVRMVAGKTGVAGGFGRSKPFQDDSRSASRTAGRLAEAARRGELDFAERPSLLPGTGEAPIRLLQKR